MQHLQAHRVETPGMSFASFIKIHYLQPVQEDDFEQHRSLPFMGLHQPSHVNICAPYHTQLKVPAPLAPPIRYFYYNEVNKPQFSAIDIFQPPRCA